ncbi:oligosaccharide flippase family protein [Citreimonas salinaria]|uniref:Membrane protein involved in the export of O-antigen and teichoic acid n=1 Tax=Citreimonas salinaria TaxID=321339 RepID=A0A1H3LS26_9RHOB|nr:oligosaccharide flippase family protein [Citreimonas salinaria]SDY66778.1 Membrane protein involved in the export of O-antigen and teichoic acid [Citreimonas salinaria]
MITVMHRMRGGSLGARAARSTLLTVAGYGGNQAIRLASNLILTRLLFPDAFGLMALVLVFLMGLSLFSDMGITPSILHSERGDDPDFLDTAWTMQVVRGFVLWGVACAGAWPVAWFYDEPMLAQLVPVAAAALAINGFKPTRMDTANRHLLLGRLTAIDLGVQVVGIGTGVVLAWLTGSVWALVASNLVAAVVEVGANAALLPGHRNRPRIERAAMSQLVHFGKWVFLATLCHFAYSQGDRILIGKWLTLETLGIYNIGFYLASFPMLLGGMVASRVLIPIYRESPPWESRAAFDRLRRMRVFVTGALLALVAGVGAAGVWLVEVLYDSRYVMAGPIVVLLACAQIPLLIAQTYDQAALARGDSRSFAVLGFLRAAFMVGMIVAGLELAGLAGAVIGQGVAHALTYPVQVWLARRLGAWDPLHDAGFAALGLGAAALAIWLNADAIRALVVAGP